MFDETWTRAHPWFAGFVISLIAVTVGLAAVGVALVAGRDEGGNGASPDPTSAAGPTPSPTATATVDTSVLTYEGPLPPALAALDLSPAEQGRAVDLRFVPNSPDGVVTDLNVLVTDPAMGVWDISRDQAERLSRGEIANWSEVGGRDLVVTVGTVGVGTSAALAQVQSFESLDGLRAELVAGSGIVALVPLSEVRSPMAAIAIDGVNPVRGDAEVDGWPFLARTGVEGLTDRGRDAVAALSDQAAWQPVQAVRVVGTGDIIPVRCSLAAIEATGDYGASFRGEVGAFLREADLAFGSWDLSLQDFSEAYRCISTVNLTAPEAAVEILVAGGLDAVTVATNHVFDCGIVAFCGADAFVNTLDVLAANGIVAIGGGTNLAEAQAAHIFEAGGITFGVLSFDDVAAMDLGATTDSPGTSPLDDDYSNERALGGAAFFAPAELLDLTRYESLIRELEPQVDFVIVQLNSGTEDTHTPSPRSLKAARAAIAAGADIVFGNQAHHVQASESIGGQFVIYAMGNFIYDQIHTPQHTHSVLTEATFWPDRLASVRLIPVVVRNYYLPEFATGDEAATILNDLSGAAQALR